MIEKPRVVAIDAGVYDGLGVDDEQERVTVVRVLVLVTPIGLLMRDALADVLDDARALGNVLLGENAPAMDFGTADLDQVDGSGGTGGHASDRHRRFDRRMMLIVHELEILICIIEQCGRAPLDAQLR